MIDQALHLAHVVVLGYWLGSELVINANFRHAGFAVGMPQAWRQKLLDHVMDVDQHVRYALVLQVGLGALLAVRLGYVEAEPWVQGLIVAATALWLAFVELVHRLRHGPWGPSLARIDRASRYGLVLLFLALAGLAPLPFWLRVKLGLFAGVIACGLAIRLALITFFAAWRDVAEHGSDPAREAALARATWRASAVLIPLWALIAAMVVLSLFKPA